MARINNQLAWNINIYHHARTLHMRSWHVKNKKKDLRSSTTYWFNSLTTICSTHEQQICQQGPTYIAGHRQHWAHKTPGKGQKLFQANSGFSLSAFLPGAASLPCLQKGEVWHTPEMGAGHHQISACGIPGMGMQQDVDYLGAARLFVPQTGGKTLMVFINYPCQVHPYCLGM